MGLGWGLDLGLMLADLGSVGYVLLEGLAQLRRL